MKKILFLLFVVAGLGAKAQVYNNEWIDYNKTYYKFNVGKTGLYRIPQSALAAAGLGAADAQHFQLWRNGTEVPIYTSVASGTFAASDYIEFWGEINDGKADKALFREPGYQLSDKWSLQTDTAAYFLTVNTNGGNFRLAPTTNNVASNSITPEPYFMYKLGSYFRNKINSGYAVDVGEYLYSSSYDKGEGWTSGDIGAGSVHNTAFANLFPAAAGPDAKFKIHLSGNAVNPRTYKVNINGTDVLVDKNVDYFNYARDSVFFNSGMLSSGIATIQVTNTGAASNDRMVIHQYELTYPRLFNFGGASNFEFELPENSGNRYLEITGFNYGSVAPVLYDLTNGKRYVGEVAGPLVKIVLEPSSIAQRFILVNEEVSNFSTVSSFKTKSFTNYALTANAGNYLIISHPGLFAANGGANAVEDYRLYRSSAEGGSYNAKTYLIDDLVDQFAFGIKKHPLSIRNFLSYARNKFPDAPKQVFLIGKGVNYVQHRYNESNPDLGRLNFIPTYGYPASDVLLSAEGNSSTPKTPIGRLSVINGNEVAVYLKKIKEFELAQRTLSPTIADKAWMKNVVHVVGASEPTLQALLDNYMNTYRDIIKDTLFGARVTTYTKTSADVVEQINSNSLSALFEQGITLITYFGHSSSNTLEFNLNNPDQYNNQGKYPVFFALGCNAGNFYNFNTARFSTTETLSEKFVLAPNRGTIGFMASSHFGIVPYLDIYNTRQYKNLAATSYGHTIGDIMQRTIKETFAYTTEDDFYARAQCEETSFHGDPAVRLNPHAKPDYVIEESLLKINPTFVSIADSVFTVNAKFLNIGRAVNRTIVREVKRSFPDGRNIVVYRDTIMGIKFTDSLAIQLPINALTDKGRNLITVTIDVDNNVDEIFETNNSITKEIIIYEDEIRPVYPYNFSIINNQNVKFYASTANPLTSFQNYRIEVDTTEKFNSPVLKTASVSSIGGLIEFNPGVSFLDSTVYYWRVGRVNANGVEKWNSNSFLYKSSISSGFNQSHFFQHQKSNSSGIFLDTVTKKWKFSPVLEDVYIRHGTFASSTGQEAGVSIYVNGARAINNACTFNSLVFVVFNPVTFQAMENPTGGLYGSGPNTCWYGRQNNFEFRYTDTASRRLMMKFMKDVIPDGSYVIVRNFNYGSNTTPGNYALDWANDTMFYGANQSLYHYLKSAGFSNVDSFDRVRPWAFIYKKNDPTYPPKWEMGKDRLDNITMSASVFVPGTKGAIQSPVFGPAQEWKTLKWLGSSLENDNDKVSLSVLGITPNGVVDTLFRNIKFDERDIDISSIDARTYPNLRLHLKDTDIVYRTPYQLEYWRVIYTPKPEGAVAPNILFAMKDTFEVGEPIDFKLAFKNVSDYPFDSLKVSMVLTDKNNVKLSLPIKRLRPLNAADTLHVAFPIDSKNYLGLNSIYIDINPDNDQPEQLHFNNFIYKNFFVKEDLVNPLLDVTFDNQHILNGDIVSSRPDIMIKLKDETKWSLLNDTSLVKIQIRFPDANGRLGASSELRSYYFNSDTLRFTPASSDGKNTATINLNPSFFADGDYELIVTGKDNGDNVAGRMEYRVDFKVINKAMISNLLNYPNPFSTSTAFVFTLTGAQVPQNFKIQVLTITGKVVREITREELGSIHIGRNITQFKWDGTDQYGQKLANGVYLYRVVADVNGHSLERYRSKNENTDKYFNNGYGKMYLMR